MKTTLRDHIRNRAANRCEYCQLHQDAQPYFRHHVEHIIPRQHGGATVEANLAWACYHCNLHKGPNLTGIDPETSLVVQLFNPRLQRWADHFAWSGVTITGLSATGRATVQVLAMNSPRRLQLRSLVHRTPTEPPAETDDPDA